MAILDDRMRYSIKKGYEAPGWAFPSERALAAKACTSQRHLQETLDFLITLGWVEWRDGVTPDGRPKRGYIVFRDKPRGNKAPIPRRTPRRGQKDNLSCDPSQERN